MKTDSKLLINEYPLQLLPSLAKAIGLNEAIFLQQVQYWLNNARKGKDTRKFEDNRWWVYNNYDEWKENFPWWSYSTIRRIVNNLEDKKLIISHQRNARSWDHTKWYTIDYDELELLLQNPPICSDWIDASSPDEQILIKQRLHTETTTETTLVEKQKNVFQHNSPDDDSQEEPMVDQEEPMVDTAEQPDPITENIGETSYNDVPGSTTELKNSLSVPCGDCEISHKNNTKANGKKAKKETIPIGIFAPFVSALANVMGLSLNLNRGKLDKWTEDLIKAGYTREQILELYSPGGAWYTHDWRGQKGQRPGIGQIRETIKNLLADKDTPVSTKFGVKNTEPAGLAGINAFREKYLGGDGLKTLVVPAQQDTITIEGVFADV